jgi:glycosyltransferase involved in cell wall biosynthesis
MGYPPNADAVLYFCRDILPLIEREVPDVRLLIVGHAPPQPVRRLADRHNVTVTGSVPDILPYYRQAKVSIVPLRGGGGTRLKILESMALGRPVVSTSIGCEGLDVDDGIHLEIADRPAEFAGSVIRLLREPARREQIATAARRRMEECYDWSIIAEKLLALYEELLATRSAETSVNSLRGLPQ